MDRFAHDQGTYAFARFQLNAARRELTRDGVAVVLTPTVFDTLVYLMENRARVVTKEELLGAIWQGRFVEESNLTQTIFVLRKTLREAGDEGRLIVTAPGRGYRFTADVLRIGETVSADAAPVSAEPLLAADEEKVGARWAVDPMGDRVMRAKAGLIPTWIVTRDDLNRAEQANITAGLRWARRGRFDVLDPEDLMSLHKRMYGAVWRWAGHPRQSEKNIGREDWWALRQHLHQLVGNIADQVERKGRDPDEIAIDFHHQLVAIHVFPNGNGRHARLAADLLAERLGQQVFSWGKSDLVDAGDARVAYVAALKAADAGDLRPLLKFARS